MARVSDLSVLSRRRVLTALTGLLMAVSLALLLAPAATAHAGLTSASPADGATLRKAPTRVALTFNEDLARVGSVVRVSGPRGSVAAGPASIDGPTLTQPLARGLTSGAYTVTFRVVSADGHPISGTTTFTLDLPSPSTTPAATTAPSPTKPVAPASSAPASVETVAGTADWRPWGLGALLVVIAGALALVALRARRQPVSPGAGD